MDLLSINPVRQPLAVATCKEKVEVIGQQKKVAKHFWCNEIW